MIPKKIIRIDNLRRNYYAKSELKFKITNILVRLKKINFFNLLNLMTEISFFSTIHNRCFLTSRGKSIHKKVRLSRIKFKELVNNGLLVGFNKYSW